MALPNIYGWICTHCHKHNSMFVGKCKCGEIRVSKDGSTDADMLMHGEYKLPKGSQEVK